MDNLTIPPLPANWDDWKRRQPRPGDYVTAVPFDSDTPIQGMLFEVHQEKVLVVTEGSGRYHTCHPGVVRVGDRDIFDPQTREWLANLRGALGGGRF